MNAEQFKEATGSEPINDDLERANCPLAGRLGHSDCGVCQHGRPVLTCLGEGGCWRKALKVNLQLGKEPT